MSRIEVKTPTGGYAIEIGAGLLARSGAIMAAALGRSCPAVVITNPTVGALYLEPLLESMNAAGFGADAAEVPDGEQYKTLETIEDIYDRLLELGVDRGGAIVALGGGVVGDMAGYAAATFMRGVPFVQVPTSLLAMVDSSVGGKTGVDLPQGKNLVGTFKQPEAVLVDPEVLGTLPPEEVAAGMAEVLKHGLIGDRSLFERLEAGKPDDFGELVIEAVRVKVGVVERDPFERSERAVLNLGHTFGHAYELVSGYALRHGEAVAVGLVAAASLGAELGECEASLVERVERAVSTHDLPTRVSGFTADDIIGAMGHDKKRDAGQSRFIVPRAPGDVAMVTDVDAGAVRRAVARTLAA